MSLAVVMFAGRIGALLERVGIYDPVTVLLRVGWVLAHILLAGAVIYAVMMAVSSARYGTEEKDEDNSVLLVVLTASLAAAVVTWMMCSGPFLRTGFGGIEQAAMYMLAAVVAGEVTLRVGWSTLETKPAYARSRLSWTLAVGWVFLPCAMLLARGRTAWLLAGAMAVVLPPVILLRRNFPARDEMKPAQGLMPYLYGTPVERGWGRQAVLVAVCAQAALVLASLRRPAEACLPMMVAMSVVAWKWSASLGPRAQPKERGLRRRAAVAAVMAFVAILMTQSMAPRLGILGSDTDASVTKADKRIEYFSVVLLPPPKKKQAIQPPEPQKPSFRGGKRKPVVIEFNGAYWYFQPPLVRPDPMAHVASGRAAEVNVHSVDNDPLIMEAHQPLLKPIDLDCCSEIDMTVSNADARPGKIAMALILRDSTAPMHKDIAVLPEETLVSSEGDIAATRAPVEEVLHFKLASMIKPPEMRRFDDITVVFVTQWSRRTSGTKVEIRSFTLVP